MYICGNAAFCCAYAWCVKIDICCLMLWILTAACTLCVRNMLTAGKYIYNACTDNTESNKIWQLLCRPHLSNFGPSCHSPVLDLAVTSGPSTGCSCFMLASPHFHCVETIRVNFCSPRNTYSCRSRRSRKASCITASMSVQEYIDKHDLSKKVEEVINACVKAKPEEPISFMVSQISYRRIFISGVFRAVRRSDVHMHTIGCRLSSSRDPRLLRSPR